MQPQAQNNLRTGEGAYATAAFSGLVTGVAGAGHLWAMRFATPAAGPDRRAFALIQRFRARLFTISGYTAAQEVQIAAYKATAFTVLHNAGGNPIVPTKKRTAAPTVLAAGYMAATGAISGQTATLAGESFAAGSYAELAAAATVPKGAIDLFKSTEDLAEHPLILGNNEGIVLRNEVAQGAGGTARLIVEVDWLELVRY